MFGLSFKGHNCLQSQMYFIRWPKMDSMAVIVSTIHKLVQQFFRKQYIAVPKKWRCWFNIVCKFGAFYRKTNQWDCWCKFFCATSTLKMAPNGYHFLFMGNITVTKYCGVSDTHASVYLFYRDVDCVGLLNSKPSVQFSSGEKCLSFTWMNIQQCQTVFTLPFVLMWTGVNRSIIRLTCKWTRFRCPTNGVCLTVMLLSFDVLWCIWLSAVSPHQTLLYSP